MRWCGRSRSGGRRRSGGMGWCGRRRSGGFFAKKGARRLIEVSGVDQGIIGGKSEGRVGRTGRREALRRRRRRGEIFAEKRKGVIVEMSGLGADLFGRKRRRGSKRVFGGKRRRSKRVFWKMKGRGGGMVLLRESSGGL